jgi:hypothetical protein
MHGQNPPQGQLSQAQAQAQAHAHARLPHQLQLNSATGLHPNHLALNAMMQQARSREQIKGHHILILKQFGDHLSSFASQSKSVESYMQSGASHLAAQAQKQQDDLQYWSNFVDKFFSPHGVLRHSVWITDEKENKQYEITNPALSRYFFTHFESGICNMQLVMDKAQERELPNNCYYLESVKSSFIYWFESGSQVCLHHLNVHVL